MRRKATTVMCLVCGAECPNRYCSNACRQRAYRSRSKEKIRDQTKPVVIGHGNSFLGREDEWVRLGQLLRRSRLVTLVGPPGIGKSRLAAEFTAKKRGAQIIDIAAASADLAVPGIDAGGFVVLDNCEHRVEECARLAERLLRSDPDLRVVATSREELRITGELLLHVGPLAPADAAQLFADRAHGPVERTDTVDQICSWLDHSPLAVELAARLVPALPPEDLLARLGHRLDLLTTGTRTGHPRHASLRAALDWSWHTLTATEQRVLRQVSVYAGGFDLATAADVCDVPAGELVVAVAALVTKSLLMPPDEHRRYHLQQSVRVYAHERLVEAGEQATTCGRARDKLAELARAVTEPVFTPATAVRRARLDRANLALAVRAAAASGDTRELLFATTLALCWSQSGYTARGRRLLYDALARTTASQADRSIALAHAGWLAAAENDHAEALSLNTAALQAAQQCGEREHLGRALNALAGVHMARGEFAESCEAYEQCLNQLDQPLDRATVRHNLSWALLQSGEVERAEKLVNQALPVYRAHADDPKLAAILHTAGALAVRRDDARVAEELFREALGRSPDEHVFPYLLEGLAITAVRRDEPERALRLLGAVSALPSGRGEQDPRWRQEVAQALDAAEAALPPKAVRGALDAGGRLDRDQVVDYARNRTWTVFGHDSPLTPREHRIAVLVARGDTNRQIARRMQVSERTVEARLGSIRQKLGLNTRTQIATWLVTHSA